MLKNQFSGLQKGELIWLEQPANGELLKQWKEHLITEGPDVNFILEDLTNDGQPEIIATEFSLKSFLLPTKKVQNGRKLS